MNPDLTTRYLGFDLKNPFLAGPCPLTGDLETLKALEEAGAAAVVLPSLFEEQIEHEELEAHRLLEFGIESFAEALDYLPELGTFNSGPEDYARLVVRARERLSIPVIASLNGHSPGGWVRYARRLEDAGADALELNAYFVPTSPGLAAAEVEKRYLDLVAQVRTQVGLPIAVKLGPYFTALPHFAGALKEAGADGLVLFNRYLHPDIDLDTLDVVPRLELSRSAEMRLPLRWIAILHGRIPLSLAATGGVLEAGDAVKLILAGADVLMVASTLLLHGCRQITRLLDGFAAWLEEKEYRSVEQAKGSMSRGNCPDPGAYERASYMKALVSYTGRFV
ncbi:MAG: dihydroorotate dehydrogenase-like protein [Planctomycetota bacterium]